METVTASEFKKFIINNCPMHVRDEPRIERDGSFTHECFDDENGYEVAYISWEDGIASYKVKSN